MGARTMMNIPTPPPGFELEDDTIPTPPGGYVPAPPSGFELEEPDTKKLAKDTKLAQELDSRLRTKQAANNNQNSDILQNAPNANALKSEAVLGPNDPFALSTGKAIAGGVWNGIRNMGVTAMSAGDWLANHTTNPEGVVSNVGQQLDENLPKYHPTNTREALVAGGTELITGMGLGGAVTKISPALQGLPRVMAAMGRFAGVNAGSVAALDSDTHPLITGDNAEYANILGNLGMDPNKGTYDEKLLKNKLQVLGEAVILAKPAEVAAKGVAGVGKMAWDMSFGNLGRWQNMSAMERQHAKDIFSELADIGPQDSAKTLKSKAETIAERIRKGADVNIPSGVKGVDDVQYQRPAMEAYVKGGEGEIGPVDVARAKAVQSAAKARKVPELDASTAQPSFKLDEVTDQTRKAFGGKESADTARKEILASANKDIANYQDEATRYEGLRDAADKSTDDLVKNDPLLGQTAQNAESGIKLDLRQQTNKAADEIVEAHNTAKGEIKQRVKGEYNKAYDMAQNENALADRKGIEDAREKVDDILPGNIKRKLDKWGGDWGTLQKDVYPELSKAANSMYKTNPYDASRLREFANHIKNSEPEIASSAVSDQLESAHKAYREELAPYKQGLSEDLSDIQRNAGYSKATGEPLRSDVLKVQSRKALKSTFNDPDQIEHTRRVLSLVPDDSKKTNYILGNFAEDLSDKIATKGVSGIDPKEVADSIRPYVGMLNPKEAKRLEKFVNDFSAKKQSVEQMNKQLDAIRKEADEVKNNIYKGELRKFFDEEGLQNLDPDQVFSNYLKDQNGENKIKQLINRVRSSNNPEAEQGLKSAYANYFKKQVFDNGVGNAGEKRINMNTVNNDHKLLEYGRLINADNPTVQKLYEKLLAEAGEAHEFSKAGQVPLRASDSFDKGARQGLDFLITMVFGQLNRWGARLRAVAGRAVSLKPTKALNIQAHGAVLSDPYKLADLIESAGSDMSKGLSSDFKKRLFNWGVLNGLYRPEQRNKLLGVDEQTEKALKK